MNNTRKTLSFLLVLPLLLLLTACNNVENDSRSASLLILENLAGKDATGAEANFLQSDVLKMTSTGGGTIVADSAIATFRVESLDPAPITGASLYYDVMLDRYTVSYSRTDGRNNPGTDVPYPFEGSLSSLVPLGTTTQVAIVVVREAAKLEPPLVGLVDLGREVVLTATAKIDFYGHDLANNQVKATGYLTVYFANYAEGE
jgi:hypothetical protein